LQAKNAGQKKKANKADHEPEAKMAGQQKKSTAMKAAGAMKRPASKAKLSNTEASPPKCPKPDDKTPIEYNGGKIYNCEKRFRVLRKRTDSYTENSFAHNKWGRAQAFKLGLKAIDEYWKNKKVLDGVKDGEDVS
jgi:hypothetical protein